MPKLTFVTGNSNKALEVGMILGIDDLANCAIDAPEIQSFSLEEIVRAKAEFAQKVCGSPVVVEDVALHFDALGGFPGPFVKFWQNEVGYDRANEILERLGNDVALVRCGVGYSDGERFFYVEGQRSGRLVCPRGESMMGFDRYFLPDGQEKTYGEMSKDEKNAISHRKLGWEAMQVRLKGEGVL
ncbi:MAG: non-canonical purine NTP pyrophosphatase [Patescibacteria group bacterium]